MLTASRAAHLFGRLDDLVHLADSLRGREPEVFDHQAQIDPKLLRSLNLAARRRMPQAFLRTHELLRRKRPQFLHTSILPPGRWHASTTAPDGISLELY
jgi:hypothetical protein